MPFGDESESEEAEVRDDEDPEITAAGRKVVHGTATNANAKAYAYLPPDELGLGGWTRMRSRRCWSRR